MHHSTYEKFERRMEGNMLYIIAAKLLDPALIVLGLAVGRLSPSVRVAAIGTAVVAVGGEWLATDGYPAMDTFLLGLVCTACWSGLGLLWRSRRRLGLLATLTTMANWMEAIERTRYTRPIGAGGGIDSLPVNQQHRAIRDLEAGMKRLAEFPKQLVTETLIKERQVAARYGQQVRADAIAKLLEHLVDQNLAVGPDDLQKSYA